jgi:hypothetical protein
VSDVPFSMILLAISFALLGGMWWGVKHGDPTGVKNEERRRECVTGGEFRGIGLSRVTVHGSRKIAATGAGFGTDRIAGSRFSQARGRFTSTPSGGRERLHSLEGSS